MTEKEQKEFITLRKEVQQLTRIVAALTRRITAYEKQMRTMKARTHQTNLDVSQLDHRTKVSAPYNPPPGGLRG